MKNNFIGFLVSITLHLGVVAQLWIVKTNNESAKPIETVTPLSLSMFQDRVESELPKPEEPEKNLELEQQQTEEKPTNTEPVLQEKPEKITGITPELKPELEPEIKQAEPEIEPKKIIPEKTKTVVRTRDKTRPIKKPEAKPEKIIKSTFTLDPNLQKQLEKLLAEPKKVIVKKPITRPIIKPIKTPYRKPETRQANPQNQVSRNSPPRVANNTSVSRRPQTKPQVGIQSRQTTTVKPAIGTRQVNSAQLETAYKSRLRQLIESQKKYPLRARKLGKQGVVKVTFVMSANGVISQIRIITSSGSRILDQSAIQTIQKVSGKLPIPEQIQKQQWTFTLPLTYQFKR